MIHFAKIKKLKRIPHYLYHPEKIVLIINSFKFGHFFPDKFFLRCLYKAYTKKSLNLKNPKTFNEKLQWLKLHDRKPEYTKMVDKYEAKKIIEEKIGKEYVVPVIGIWDKFEDIDFESLPQQFVLKCTHSGGVIVCKDKLKLDLEEAKRKINRSLNINYFWHGREWPYKNVEPKIMAEEFIPNSREEDTDSSLVVYKVFCFNGEPRILQVIQNDKREDESIDYFDTDWKLLNLKQNFPNSEVHLDKPERFEEMLCLSKKLSEGKTFLRVDWYVSNGRLLFSEFTFYSDAGVASFKPEEWDYKLGQWIDLTGISEN